MSDHPSVCEALNLHFRLSYPNIHRIDRHDANDSRHLAILPRHPQHHSCVRRHYESANVLSCLVLESPIPLPPDPDPQAPVVLRLQDRHRSGCFTRGGHLAMRPSWRRRRHLGSKGYRFRIREVLVDSLVHVKYHGRLVRFPLHAVPIQMPGGPR